MIHQTDTAATTEASTGLIRDEAARSAPRHLPRPAARRSQPPLGSSQPWDKRRHTHTRTHTHARTWPFAATNMLPIVSSEKDRPAWPSSQSSSLIAYCGRLGQPSTPSTTCGRLGHDVCCQGGREQDVEAFPCRALPDKHGMVPVWHNALPLHHLCIAARTSLPTATFPSTPPPPAHLSRVQQAQADCVLAHAHKAARAVDGVEHPVAPHAAAGAVAAVDEVEHFGAGQRGGLWGMRPAQGGR